ncbi:MAG TPA: MFS transporter [Candidatus Sulfotelmatobacter sp.]
MAKASCTLSVTLAPVMLIGGAARVLFISLINALLQNLAPDWVRARVLAIFILVYQGSFALGSAVCGAVAQRAGIRVALIYVGIGTIGSTVFALFAKLPNSTEDLSPWNHLRMPVAVEEVAVIREREAEFVKAIHQYAHIRRRDGAYRWGIFRDTETADHYLEIFLVNSWAEHLRQHERQTQADHELERHLHDFVATEPEVRHLIYAYSKET